MSVIQKIWKDTVGSQIGSQVIAGLILAAILGAPAIFWGYVKDVHWTSPVELTLWQFVAWIILTLVCALWIAMAMRFGVGPTWMRQPDTAPEQSRAEINTPFSGVELDTPLLLRYTCIAESRFGGGGSGKGTWEGTYLAAFKLIGPKLRLEPVERMVKSSLGSALAVELGYEIVHVVDHDFQSMKIRLENFGVIYFGKGEKASFWGLTDNGLKLLAKIHQ